MTVKELKKSLENAPDNMDVFIHQENDEFTHNSAESAIVEKVKFRGEKEIPEIECFVISDLN